MTPRGGYTNDAAVVPMDDHSELERALELLHTLEELLEVALAEAAAAAALDLLAVLAVGVVEHAADALDDLEEERRAVAQRPREHLDQHALVVAIDQQPELLRLGEVLGREEVVADALGQLAVVSADGAGMNSKPPRRPASRIARWS